MIQHNGLWNSCRESGDHGAINTWDRTPYLTTLRTGKPSLIPSYNNVSHNMIISNYNSFDGIDNDDGSSYYDISFNVFYLNEGLKSDYHGHGKLYHDNINVGAGVCCFQFGFISGRGASSNIAGPAEFYEAGQADQCYNNRCIQRPGGSWSHGCVPNTHDSCLGSQFYFLWEVLLDKSTCEQILLQGVRNFVGLQRQHRRWELRATRQGCDDGAWQPNLPGERSGLPIQLRVRYRMRHGQQQRIHAFDDGLSNQMWPRGWSRGASRADQRRDCSMVPRAAIHTGATTVSAPTWPSINLCHDTFDQAFAPRSRSK